MVEGFEGSAAQADCLLAESERFHRVIANLSDIYYPSGVVIWLNSPNRKFGGRKPSDLIGRGTDSDWAQLLEETERLAWT